MLWWSFKLANNEQTWFWLTVHWHLLIRAYCDNSTYWLETRSRWNFFIHSRLYYIELYVRQVIKQLLQEKQNIATLSFVPFYRPIQTAYAGQARNTCFAVSLRGRREKTAFTLVTMGEIGTQLVATRIAHVTATAIAALATLLVSCVTRSTVSSAFTCWSSTSAQWDTNRQGSAIREGITIRLTYYRNEEFEKNTEIILRFASHSERQPLTKRLAPWIIFSNVQ